MPKDTAAMLLISSSSITTSSIDHTVFHLRLKCLLVLVKLGGWVVDLGMGKEERGRT